MTISTWQGLGGLFVLVGGFLGFGLGRMLADMSSEPLLQIIRTFLYIIVFVMALLIWTESTVACVVTIFLGLFMLFGNFFDAALFDFQPGPLWGHFWVDALLVLIGGFMGLPLESEDQNKNDKAIDS